MSSRFLNLASTVLTKLCMTFLIRPSLKNLAKSNLITKILITYCLLTKISLKLCQLLQPQYFFNIIKHASERKISFNICLIPYHSAHLIHFHLE
jgi:hypothetical protein